MASFDVIDIFDILLCGAPGVGKSTFVRRITEGIFVKDHLPEPTSFTVKINTGEMVSLRIFERNSTDFSGYPEGLQSAIVMFDVNDFEGTCPPAKEMVETLLKRGIFVVLCGTKIDAIKGHYMDMLAKKKSFIDSLKAAYNLVYFEVSPKSCSKFNEPFMALIHHIFQCNETYIVG